MAQENMAPGSAGNQGGYGSAPVDQQASPYTNYDSKDQYVKAGYGGDTFQPAVEPKEQQPDYYSAGPPPPAAPRAAAAAAPDEGAPPQSGGMKEKIKEKLAPCIGGGHTTATPDQHTSSPPKQGVLEKIKEKVSPRSS